MRERIREFDRMREASIQMIRLTKQILIEFLIAECAVTTLVA
jgi:hypothetical protein